MNSSVGALKYFFHSSTIAPGDGFLLSKTNSVSKKALLALCMAIALPVVSYLLVKHYGDEAVVMPRRFYEDSIITRVNDGKMSSDTIWHQVKNITLTNQLGKTITLDQLKGKILVVDFFFTHCGSICPTLARNMKKLQEAVKHQDNIKYADTSFVQFLSFSIDPERDSVPVLKRYADKFGVNHDTWWMLTGPKKTIYDFAFEELKVDRYNDEPIDSSFVHTSRFTLIDKDGVVRGYYNGLDDTSLAKLGNDMVLLMLEKDKKKKSELLTEITAIWPIFIIAILAVIIFLFINRKPKF
ncbi:MAG: SCO family protein [Bacteroidota bacterium]